MPDAAFQDKKVLITGAGRGIGAACAELFARKGAWVLIVARTLKEIEKQAEESPEIRKKASLCSRQICRSKANRESFCSG